MKAAVEPDLSWWEGKRCLFVGDIKYKRIDTTGPNADLYQLLAYTVAANLNAGTLVYASGESAPAAHEVVHLGTHLHVFSLDLSGAPDQILDQIRLLAQFVSTSRQDAVTYSAAV